MRRLCFMLFLLVGAASAAGSSAIMPPAQLTPLSQPLRQASRHKVLPAPANCSAPRLKSDLAAYYR